jgi:hypothetical protein
MGWVVSVTLRPLYPRARPGNHCIGGSVGPRFDLDGCGKSRHHRDSIPGPSSLLWVTIPTELSRPPSIRVYRNYYTTQVTVEVRQLYCIQDVPGSNLCMTSNILRDFVTLIRFAHANVSTLLSVGHDRFLPNSSRFAMYAPFCHLF